MHYRFKHHSKGQAYLVISGSYRGESACTFSVMLKLQHHTIAIQMGSVLCKDLKLSLTELSIEVASKHNHIAQWN